MNLQKLAKDLQRDFKANPKKGLVLVLLLAAGVYFWGPILKRWTLAASTQSIPIIAQDDPRTSDKPIKPSRAIAWDKIDRAQAKDKRTQPLPAGNAAFLNNPFVQAALDAADVKLPGGVPTEGEEETEEEEVVIEIPEEEDFKPSQVGLIVSSVSIGPKGRLACIGGAVYGVGETIPIPVDPDHPDDPPLEPFQVTQIETWGVVYERKDKTYAQELGQPQLRRNDKIAWGGAEDKAMSEDTD